ncbi:MAG: transporter substrate-binding domain-containing protein [Prevotellaceae bacterium]|jgi:membrane-bound lytic murein transglycosylase MltF|nr:transporter substrate-binding domain-containing protein [Prevotellaceae bacterium]
MATKKNHFWKYFALCLAGAVITTFILEQKKDVQTSPRDYPDIDKQGVLHAATEYNSISYYVDGDTLSGFYYELIRAFARRHHWQLVLTPEMSIHARLDGLARGRYDVIAYGIPTTNELKDSLLLTLPIVRYKQVLVQRKPATPDDTLSINTPDETTRFIKSQLELAGCTLNVVKDSPAILRIRNLSKEIADTIYVNEIDNYGPEQLIAMVVHGDIDYAVCDENIATTLADSMPQIDISTAISFTQLYSWGVSKQSPLLLDSLNRWLETFLKGDTYRQIYKRYHP